MLRAFSIYSSSGRLRSRTLTAQINEALCKVLCHNLCVVILNWGLRLILRRLRLVLFQQRGHHENVVKKLLSKGNHRFGLVLTKQIKII